MGRAFTIDFTFRGQVYTALVFIRDKNNTPSIQVNFFDSAVAAATTTGKVFFEGTYEIADLVYENGEVGKELAWVLHSAIDQHLAQVGVPFSCLWNNTRNKCA